MSDSQTVQTRNGRTPGLWIPLGVGSGTFAAIGGVLVWANAQLAPPARATMPVSPPAAEWRDEAASLRSQMVVQQQRLDTLQTQLLSEMRALRADLSDRDARMSARVDRLMEQR